MAGLSFIKAKPISVDATRSTSLRGVPMQDKLMALGSILQGDTGALQQLQLLAAARQQQAEQSAAEKDLADFMSQKGVPRRPAAAPSFDPMTEGGPTTPGAGISAIPRVQLPERAPQADAIGGPVSMRSAIPMLAEAMRRKVPLATVKEYREQIQGAEPKYSYVNNVRIDERDPNAPKEIFEVDKGQRHVFDAEGRPIGVMNADGYVRAAAETASAVEGAKQREQARYDVGRYDLPNGGTVQIPRLKFVEGQDGVPGPPPPPNPNGPPVQVVGSGVPMRGGLGRSQTPAAKVLSEERAKAQSEREVAAPKAYSGLKAQAAATDLVLEHLDRILGIGPDGMPTGKSMIKGGLGGSAGLNALLKGVPETAAYNLDALLDPIKANIGFDKLADMRANSPTGGALGQVSDTENKLLQSVYESVKQGQSPDQLQANLLRLRKELAAAREARRTAFGRQYNDASSTAGTTKAPASQITPEQARAELARRRAGGQ